MEENLIIGVWDVFKDYISEKNRDTAANHYVDFLLGHDIDPSVLSSYVGYDTHLDHAINLVVEDDQDFEEKDDDDSEDY